MKKAYLAVLGTATLTATAHADLVGWTSSIRQVSGGYLVNVFAVVDNPTDLLVNVSGGTSGSISTTSSTGFLQGAGAQALFAPSGNQSWTTLDSFLTVGGNYDFANQRFFGNGATTGDSNWLVSFTDVDGNPASANAFSTPTDPESGFRNRYTNNIPLQGGWFLNGPPYAQARPMSALPQRLYSSSAAAAAATGGFMVAQLFVAELSLPGSGTVGKYISWDMKATVQREGLPGQNIGFAFTIGEVPAPGALAVLGLAGLAGRRRRRC